MTIQSDTPPARLFTTWGTVLYVHDSGELRHGPRDTSPGNVLLVTGAPSTGIHQCQLVHDTGLTHEPIVCMGEHSWSASSVEAMASPGAPTIFEILPIERGLLGLKCGTLYLTAHSDGRLTLVTKWCSTWECFLASEDWCTDIPSASAQQIQETAEIPLDKKKIAGLVIEPLLRAEISAKSRKQRWRFWTVAVV